RGHAGLVEESRAVDQYPPGANRAAGDFPRSTRSQHAASGARHGRVSDLARSRRAADAELPSAPQPDVAQAGAALVRDHDRSTLGAFLTSYRGRALRLRLLPREPVLRLQTGAAGDAKSRARRRARIAGSRPGSHDVLLRTRNHRALTLRWA